MFAYCTNNPVNYCDPEGTEYRPVGAGIQVEVDIGNSSYGLEIIIYWDTKECENGGVVVAVYTYVGISVDMDDAFVGAFVALMTDNSILLPDGTKDSGVEACVLALAALISDTFSVSASGVLIFGNESFTSTESYEESFTSIGASWGKVRGSYAYSDSCRAVSVGGNLVGAKAIPSWGVSKTYYKQALEFKIGGQTSSASRTNSRGGGGTGGVSRCTKCTLI